MLSWRKGRFNPGLWRHADDLANIYEVHLPAIACMGGINDNLHTIRTQSWMQVAPPLTLVFLGRKKSTYIDSLILCHMIKIQAAKSLFIGIGVIYKPFGLRQAIDMTIQRH